jgi:hypothetical protein
MAISAAIQPIKTEYKPLGLEAFAKPLSAMQEKFDTTKSEIEAADFGLSRLSKDDPRAKALLEEIESAKEELAQNLMTTTNYRQAAQKLLRLNKQWNKDPETLAIKGNYEAYNAAKADVDKMVETGKLNPEDAKLWDFQTLGEFSGTKFANGKYSSINAERPMENMEKAIREESLKVAGMTADQIIEYVTEKNADAFTKERIQTLIKEKKFDQIAPEILNFLKTSDTYKQWLTEKGNREFYYKNKTDENFKYTLPEETVNLLDYNISTLNKALGNPNLGEEGKANIKSQLQSLNNQKNQIVNTYNSLTTPEEFEQFSRDLYLQHTQNKLKDIADSAADIVDYKSTTYTITDQVDQEAKAKAAGSLKLLDEIGDVTVNSVSTTGNKNTLIKSGDASGNVDITPFKQATYEQIKANTPADIPQLKNIKVNPGNTAAVNSLEASKDMFIVLGRTDNINNQITDKEAQVELLKKQLTKASGADKNRITEELNTARQDVQELKVGLTSENQTLTNIIESTTNDPEIKKLWEESGKSIIPFMQKINTATVNYLQGTPTASAEAAKADFIKRETSTMEWDAATNSSKLVPNPMLTPEEIKAIEIKAENLFNAKNYVDASSAETKKLAEYSTRIMGAYRQNLAVNQYAIGQEISYTEGTDKFMNGKFSEAIDYIIKNQRGDSPAVRVDFNVKTGKTKLVDNNNFDLAAYESTPHYAGLDQAGKPLFRYVRKTAWAEGAKTANSLIANSIKTQRGGVVESPNKVLKPEEEKAWRAANPQDLYLSLPGWGGNPSKAAEDNYVEIASTALQINNMDAMQQNVANYAPVHLISDAKRRESYYEMSARLEDAVKNGHKFTEIVQPPAAWKDNGNGTFTGFAITYKVIDGQVLASVNQGILGKNNEVTWQPVQTYDMQSFSNLPTGLVQLDLMYGTGDEDDLVRKSGLSSGPFVPAFR